MPRLRIQWLVAALAIAASSPVAAQQPQQPPPPQRPPVAPAAPAAPAAAPQPQRPAQTWETMPRMVLERQFAGPLRDTIVQRWRDPADGTVCYIYLPITAQHSPPTESGFVQYGANAIGSISCAVAPAPRSR